MRRLAIAAVGVLLAAGLGAGLTGQADAVSPKNDLTFVPDLASPGDVVTVKTDACKTTSTGLVYTKDLGGTVMLGPVGSGNSEGYFRVRSSAEPGSHTVRGACADGTPVGGVLRVPELWIGRPGG